MDNSFNCTADGKLFASHAWTTEEIMQSNLKSHKKAFLIQTLKHQELTNYDITCVIDQSLCFCRKLQANIARKLGLVAHLKQHCRLDVNPASDDAQAPFIMPDHVKLPPRATPEDSISKTANTQPAQSSSTGSCSKSGGEHEVSASPIGLGQYRKFPAAKPIGPSKPIKKGNLTLDWLWGLPLSGE